jgi:hypothetical protein
LYLKKLFFTQICGSQEVFFILSKADFFDESFFFDTVRI